MVLSFVFFLSAEKLKIGLLPYQAYMESELATLSNTFDIFHIGIEENNWSEEEVAKWVEQVRAANAPAVVGFAQKDAYHHVLLNRALGNTTISYHAYLIAMNKYMQRTIEQTPFWFVPINPLEETNEEIAAKIPAEEWPFMLKNTSLSLGRGVFKCANVERLNEILDMYRADASLQV